jgi:hypothetical protein
VQSQPYVERVLHQFIGALSGCQQAQLTLESSITEAR